MADEITYEVHRFRDGKWEMQGFMNDRELALQEAKRLAESKWVNAGIRVIEERYDHQQERALTRTIYNVKPAHQKTTSKPEPQKTASHRTATARRRPAPGPRKQGRPARSAKSSVWLYCQLATTGLLICIAGLGTIYALQQALGGG